MKRINQSIPALQITGKQKNNRTRFSILVSLMLIMLTALNGLTLYAQTGTVKSFNNTGPDGLILDGYDPVAFFTDNKPVKGDPALKYQYDNATYYFSSAEHLNLFKVNPEKYKPQFGGWCAYAVSLGRVAPVDVSTFSITDGRLFLQHNQRAVNGWNKDVPGNIIKADKYWPGVVEKKGKQITTDEEKIYFSNTDDDGLILNGYDVVAYYTQMRAVKGEAMFSARYNGATYWFSSEQHAAMFKDHPEMFAPQYGAFCGYAMSQNKLRPVDPRVFSIIDGRLILQHSADALARFNQDTAGNIARADQNWPAQVKSNAGKKVNYDAPDGTH